MSREFVDQLAAGGRLERPPAGVQREDRDGLGVRTRTGRALHVTGSGLLVGDGGVVVRDLSSGRGISGRSWMRRLATAVLLCLLGCTFDPPGRCEVTADCPEGVRCRNGVCSGCDVDADCDTYAVCGSDHRCRCAEGFVSERMGEGCTDVDECAVDNGGCGDPGVATCTNAPGSFSCTCAPGFRLDGGTCRDVDECRETPDICGADRICENRPGSYACRCTLGQRDQDGTCVNDLREDAWVSNGEVTALVFSGDKLYAGGHLDFVAPAAPGFAVFETSFEYLYPAGQVVLAQPRCVVADGQGGWFVGREAASSDEAGIVHVLADGSADALFHCPGPMAPERLALTEGTLFAIGSFAHTTGAPTTFAAFDAVSGAPRTDLPLPDGPCADLVADGPMVYLGGSFSHVDAAPRAGLAAVDARMLLLTPWAPPAGSVELLAAGGGRVFVSGAIVPDPASPEVLPFASFDGTSGAFVPWLPPVTGVVRRMVFADTRVLIAGSVTATINHYPTYGLLGFDTATAAPVFFGAGLREDTAATDVAYAGQKVFVSGVLADLRIGRWHRSLSYLSPLGTAVGGWYPVTGGPIRAIAHDHNRLAIVGDFPCAQGVGSFPVVIVDPATGKAGVLWYRFLESPAMSPAWIDALAVTGDTVDVGGTFDTAELMPRHGLASVNGLVTPWNPPVDASSVRGIVRTESAVFVAAQFRDPGGAPRPESLLAFDPTTGQAVWPMPVSGPVLQLAYDARRLYVRGSFTEVDGSPRPGLAAFDGDNRALLSFHPRLREPPRAMAAGDGLVFVDGPSVSDGVQPHVLDGETGEDRGVLPIGSAGAVAMGYGAGFLVQVDASGELSVADVAARKALPLRAHIDGQVNVVATNGKAIAVGGLFPSVDGKYRPNLVIFGH